MLPGESRFLVVVDSEQRILCRRRVNQPARGLWFVPGGRILKYEPLDDAVRRVAQADLGVGGRQRSDAGLLEVFEHLYDTNFADAPDIATHYVVLGYRIDVDDHSSPPDEPHSKYAWLSRSDVESGAFDGSVHPNNALTSRTSRAP